MSDIKIICCDIDGTLVRDDKSLSETNKLWIKKAVEEKGVKFVLVSGRILNSLEYFNRVLGIKGLTSSLNGTYLTDENGKVLANHTMSRDIAEQIVQVYRRHSAGILFISGNEWYTEDHTGYVFTKKLPIYMKESIVVKMEDAVKTIDINKFLFMSEDKTVLEEVEKDLRKTIEDPNGVCFYQGPDFLEVMPGGINKGNAVDDLISYYKLDRNNVMALGDDINDLEMIQKAGLGIAMGNALDCVKKVAVYVTDTNENDGVAKAIEKFLFVDALPREK